MCVCQRRIRRSRKLTKIVQLHRLLRPIPSPVCTVGNAFVLGLRLLGIPGRVGRPYSATANVYPLRITFCYYDCTRGC